MYRNSKTFYPSDPTSQSKPTCRIPFSGLLNPLGGINEDSSDELRYEDCISDDESSSKDQVRNIKSTSVVLRSLHRNVHKSPGSNWDYELIIDSGANASLVCERRLLSKLVPLKSKVKGIDDTLLLDVKGQGCLKIRLDNGSCQKLKHCSTFIIYKVSSALSYFLCCHLPKNGKVNKPRRPMHRAGDKSREGDYITKRGKKKRIRERTSYIDYLYVTSLLCNPVLRRKQADRH